MEISSSEQTPGQAEPSKGSTQSALICVQVQVIRVTLKIMKSIYVLTGSLEHASDPVNQGMEFLWSLLSMTRMCTENDLHTLCPSNF